MQLPVILKADRMVLIRHCRWLVCRLSRAITDCIWPKAEIVNVRQEIVHLRHQKVFQPGHDKTNKMACAPSENSDQPGHRPSLIRVFAIGMKKALVFLYLLSPKRRLWSDRADAQVDLSLCWAHMPFVWFCHVLAHFIFRCCENIIFFNIFFFNNCQCHILIGLQNSLPYLM